MLGKVSKHSHGQKETRQGPPERYKTGVWSLKKKKKKGKEKNPFIRTETGLAIRGIQKTERSGKIKLFPK